MQKVFQLCIWFVGLSFVETNFLALSLLADESELRFILPLEDWVLSREEGSAIKTRINDSWETVMGNDFDGKAIYRTTLPTVNRTGRRLFLHFEAVATHAVVKVDGKVVGEHIGGWTPFRVDITNDYQPEGIVEVVVDERPGHNTQGFLPVFIPHFGGIWGKVELITVSQFAHIDDLSLFAAGWEPDRVKFQISVHRAKGMEKSLSVGVRKSSTDSWHWKPLSPGEPIAALELAGEELNDWPIWTLESPAGTRCEIVLRDDTTEEILDRQIRRVYRRHVTAVGRDIHLNGTPITVRGVLNWGYAPPRLCPSRDRQWMQKELEFIKARGFNTMKFCLWIPPAEYLELCDEMGILAWVEYPTWHPKLTRQFLPQLLREYEEFFQHDRNHPSVILRSLTCETGHSAELDVIRELYDKAHAMIPGSLVEDDSSWISWQRVHDFYDDHPYGNNHKWKGVLQGLDDFISKRSPKPLVLGEAIAADTWTNTTASMPPEPHALISHLKTDEAEKRIQGFVGKDDQWKQASADHAHETRKFQIERYRHQLPRQGFNVSVIRDFPFASMGLIDFENKPKSTPEQWRWHGEQMICLETQEDRRSFFGGTNAELEFHLLQPGLGAHQLEWSVDGTSQQFSVEHVDKDNTGKLTIRTNWRVANHIGAPKRVTLAARWIREKQTIAQNEWNLWVVPTVELASTLPQLYVHESCDLKIFGDGPTFQNAEKWQLPLPASPINPGVVVARSFDMALWRWLCEGGMVLMIPDGQAGSFPVAEHWFLRGGPIINHRQIGEAGLSSMIESLQAFDLAGPVMTNPDYLDEVEPLVLLWDNHDIREYRFHACSWGANVGRGRLFVSTLAADAARGAATQAFLTHAIHRIASAPFSKSLGESTQAQMESDLRSELVEVPRHQWRFRPDPNREGIDAAWHRLPFDDNWGEIRIGEHWDGQGHQGLDGWAWYSRQMTLPKEANYMIFTGVDDYFEVFIDGVKCGSGGDLEKRKTAFDMVVAIPIPPNNREHSRVSVLVDDWQGAGGIFRKVYFSSELPSSKPAVLQRKTRQYTSPPIHGNGESN